MSPIEITAAAFGVLSVWLTVRQNIWCWPTGLVMVALYTWIFFDARLYSDAALQVVYIALSLYGWVHWARGGPRESRLPVTALTPLARTLWIAAGLASAAALGYVMDTRTDASLPYFDALTTTLSLVAQYLMTRKKWESWVFWLAVDVTAVGVYIAKDLYVTSALYALFLVLATMGLLAWLRETRQPAASSSGSSSPPTADTNS